MPDPEDDEGSPERGVAHLRVDDDDIEPLGQIIPPQVIVEQHEPPPEDE